MRNGRYSLVGVAAILLGIVIVLSIVLPSQFWWFVLAGALIALGVWLNSRCCC